MLTNDLMAIERQLIHTLKKIEDIQDAFVNNIGQLANVPSEVEALVLPVTPDSPVAEIVAHKEVIEQIAQAWGISPED